jgi:hypothetical protein
MCWEQHWGCAYKSEFPPDPCAVIDIHFISAYIMNLLILGCFHLNCMLSLKQIKMKEIFFGNTGVWIQGFQIARQVSYLLSHLQPLCSGYFQDRVLLFAWAGLDMILLFILDGRHIPPCPAVFCFAIEMGFLDLFFLPRLAWELWSQSQHSVELGGRHMLLCPAIGWDGVLQTFYPGLALNRHPSVLYIPSS